MKHAVEFSRFSHQYEKHNIIQQKVLQHLLKNVDIEDKHILDLGCGSGQVHALVCRNMASLTGVDIASGMCDLHPRGEGIVMIEDDFENPDLYKKFIKKFDMVISSSALQWSNDINAVFEQVAKVTDEVHFAIFTQNTFKTVHRTASLSPLLKDASFIEEKFNKHFIGRCTLQRYALGFEDTRSMFRYIKNSGVSGGRGHLGVRDMRRLLKEYPKDYLEFEVLFCSGKPASI